MNKSWKDAVIAVLSESDSAMHYTDIAEEISKKGLRDDLGATPANTVAATISTDIKNNGPGSIFVKASERGYYMLNASLSSKTPAKKSAKPQSKKSSSTASEDDKVAAINAFGMYWRRDYVQWKQAPQLLGRQQLASKVVDFSAQIGVYMLHSETGVVYVGRASDQSLGTRLYQHTLDRLNGRWSRFSWFGIKQVKDTGNLVEPDFSKLDTQTLITAMEALLIEGLEPPQNRRRGDEIGAVEYMQAKDPELERKEQQKLVQELLNSINLK